MVVLAYLQPTMNRSRRRHGAEAGAPCVFLFDRAELLDATDGARALLAASPLEGDAWTRFLAFAAPRFPGVEEKLARLADLGRLCLPAASRTPMTLRAEWHAGLIRIVISQQPCTDGAEASDGLDRQAMEEEVETLRSTLDRAPLPVWREDATGTVTWANRPYMDLAGRLEGRGEVPAWPLPAVFPGGDGATARRRHELALPGQEDPGWYDILSFPQGGDRIHYALPADEAAHAQAALRSFVQTLTKTFAHLTIGLAIFDGKRQLALFNPALIELTGLTAEFLSSRPSLFRMLDAMREHQMLPEPQDYKAWRTEIVALEQAAATGQFEETWTLPGGQTYRVTGQPHPDGALAFVLEDISAEMTLNRRFRADLELSHAVIDCFDEAVAVFSPSGLLVHANAAYGELWHDAADAGGDTSITEAVRSWQRRSSVSPVWSEARAFVLDSGVRKPWQGEARLSDGRLLACRFAALPGGASLIGFSMARADGTRRLSGVAGGKRQTA